MTRPGSRRSASVVPGSLAAADVDHVVITRFSALYATGQPPFSQEWLDYRLGFFVDACLPSVLSQTVRDFRWIVVLDDRCSPEFREVIEELADGAFEPVWTHRHFMQVLPEELAARAERPFLLTTRLDSDDAVARDFVAATHRELADVDRLVVDFPYGLQVDRSGAVYRDHLQSNHFASLLERRKNAPPLTVFATAHPKLRRIAPIRRVVTEPMWLEVVHGGNLLNGVRGARIAPDVVAQRFDIDLTYRDTVDAATLRRERRRQARALAAVRLRNPHVALAGYRSLVDRVRGTRTVPWDPGPSLGERFTRLRHRVAAR